MTSAHRFRLYRVFRDAEFIAGRGRARGISRCVEHVRPAASDTWIDVGCGSKPYESLFDVDRYVGLDVEVSGHPTEDKQADRYFDGVHLPFEDASVDGVMCTEVLEHATDFGGLVEEIARVMRPGASAIVSSPFVWPEHEQPYDFRRFTSIGLELLFRSVGLDVELAFTTAGSHASIAQLDALHAHSVIGAGIPGWSAIVTLLVCAPVQLFGLAMQAILPDRGGFYIETVLVLRKPRTASPS